MVFEMKNIRKSFGDLEVLKDISLNVDSGEVVSIIGPSGSGKSTLLRCATFLETVDAGEIRYMDNPAVTTEGDRARYVTPAELRSDLTWLKEEGYHPVTMARVIAYADGGAALPEKPIVLSFDDGLTSACDRVLPLLRELDMPIVLSVIAGSADEFTAYRQGKVRLAHAAWPQLRELAESGLVELQNHSYGLHRATEGGWGCDRLPGESPWLISEDGSAADAGFAVMAEGQDTVTEVNGKVADPLEPSLQEIACLMLGPELTHKGDWSMWLGGAALCLITWLTVLFADELFRLQMSFRIRNAEEAEPSEWEMAGRYISWTILPLLALFAFAAGLQI